MPPKHIPEVDLSLFPERMDSSFKDWRRRIESVYHEYLDDATCRNRLRLRVATRLSVEMQEEMIDEGIETWAKLWEHLLKLDVTKGAGEIFSERIEIVGTPSGTFRKWSRRYTEVGLTEQMLMEKIS